MSIPHQVPARPAVEEGKKVSLNIDYGTPNFRWQMYFNAFVVVKMPNGVMAKVAYVEKGSASEVVQIFVSEEGLNQLKQSAGRYMQDFVDAGADPEMILPEKARVFSPLFSNHVRLARSGNCAEVSFFTVPMIDIATAARAPDLKKLADSKCVQVALLHSDIRTHATFALNLLASAP